MDLSEILLYLELMKKEKKKPSLRQLRMMLYYLEDYDQVKEFYNKLEELKLKVPMDFYSDSLIHFIEDYEDCISFRNKVLPLRDKRKKHGYSILFIQQILLSKSEDQAICIIKEAKDYGIMLSETWAKRYNSMWEIKRDHAEWRKNIGYYECHFFPEIYEEFCKMKSKYFEGISLRQLKQTLLDNPSNKNTQKITHTSFYDRSVYIKEFARRVAKGICQLCNKEAPFLDNQGKPFLEVHHIHYLSNGGSDTIDNVVALCPNCHRRIHQLGLEEDVKKLTEKVVINMSIEN